MHRAQANGNNIKADMAQFIVPLQIGKYRFLLPVFTSAGPLVLELR